MKPPRCGAMSWRRGGTPLFFLQSRIMRARPHPGRPPGRRLRRACCRQRYPLKPPLGDTAYMTLQPALYSQGTRRAQRLRLVRQFLVTEANSATGQPLISPTKTLLVDRAATSTGSRAPGVDSGLALAYLPRLERARAAGNPTCRGLPPSSPATPACRSVFMIAQSPRRAGQRFKGWRPASVDSIPPGGEEDPVSGDGQPSRFAAAGQLETVLGLS